MITFIFFLLFRLKNLCYFELLLINLNYTIMETTLKDLYLKYSALLQVAIIYRQKMIDDDRVDLLGKARVRVNILTEIVNDLDEACAACV